MTSKCHYLSSIIVPNLLASSISSDTNLHVVVLVLARDSK